MATEAKATERFSMYGPHVLKSSNFRSIHCVPNFNASTKEINYNCVVHTVAGPNLEVSFSSKEEVTNANQLVTDTFNKHTVVFVSPHGKRHNIWY